MMDRDLGARKGGFPGITIGEDFTVMDAVNTFGLLYQWGRKDPFFPSADGTNKETDIIYDGNGFSTGIKNTHTQASMNTAIANPSTFYTYSNGVWNTESNRTKFWNADGNMAPGKRQFTILVRKDGKSLIYLPMTDRYQMTIFRQIPSLPISERRQAELSYIM